jgi:signal peptidase I
MTAALTLEPEAGEEPARKREFGSSARLWGGFLGRAWLWFITGCMVITFMPMLFGWRPYVVESGSMQPRIKVGDVILESPERDPKKLLGHVTVFKDPDPSRGGTVKSHRVVKINDDGTLETKGDANPTPDPTPLPISDVKGIGRLLVRWIGLPLIWVQTGQWLKLGLLILTVWIAAVLVVRDRDHEPIDGDDDGDGDNDELDDDVDERDVTPDADSASVWRWRSARVRLPRLGRSRHRRPSVAAQFRHNTAVRLAAIATAAVALLVPTAQAAFDATTFDNTNQWSAVALTSTSYTTDAKALGPYLYWKLDETTSKNGTLAAADSSGNNRTGTYNPKTNGTAGAWTMNQTGALVDGGQTNLAVEDATGNANTCIYTTNNTAINPAPTVYSEIIWFRTTSTTGGKLIGFESARTGVSDSSNGGQYDRHIYMDAAGHLWFGVWTGATTTVESPNTYNDGVWHMAVATMGASDGMKLYVDGNVVGTNANTVSQSYAATNGGFWRVGCGNLSGWGSWTTQTNYPFIGWLDEAAVYTTELTATDIADLYYDR